jgi:hypothetical protein
VAPNEPVIGAALLVALFAHHLVGDVEVGENLLDVVILLQGVDDSEGPYVPSPPRGPRAADSLAVERHEATNDGMVLPSRRYVHDDKSRCRHEPSS